MTSTRPGRTYAGSRVTRVEDERLLTGKGTYVDDVVRPGMLHACFVRSPFARARIGAIDTSAALALDGVAAVFVAADLNGEVNEAWYPVIGKDVPDTPRPPLAEQFARFVGDPVALVVAESRAIAEDAAELVDVDWDPLDPVVDYRTAAESPHLVHDGYESNVAGRLRGRGRDAVAEAFDAAAHTVEETFRQAANSAVPIETRGIVVEWSGEDLTIWAATQSPHEMRGFCARLLDLPEDRIRVIMRDTGGGFGQKTVPMREDMCLMLIARKVPAPIKWIEDRRENLMSAGQARHEHGEAGFAFAEDGTIVAGRIDHVQDVGAYPTPWPVGTAAAVGMIYPGPYRVPCASWTTTSVFSNTAGRTAYRGPWQFESVARELLLDIAARQMGVDPADLRRRNMLRADELPYANPNGMTYTAMTPLEAFELALELIDYDAFRQQQIEARSQGRYLGIGTGSYAEPTTSGAVPFNVEEATIRIDPTGQVTVLMSGGSSGNSIETSAVQLAADALGIDIADVSTFQGDTAVTPFGAGTAGSRSGSMVAGAIAATAAILRDRIAHIAASQLEAPVADIEVAGGWASVEGDQTRRISIARIAAIAHDDPSASPEGVSAGLEATGRYETSDVNIWANATHACTCEVDIETGIVTLLRYVVSEDCGPMINPSIVEGQIAGGTAQGIGGALLENLSYDEEGNPTATTFLDYLLPTMADVPIIEYGHIETPSTGPGGYKGVGEGGAIGSVPAVVNAVADALAPLGVKITDVPVTPASIVAAVRR